MNDHPNEVKEQSMRNVYELIQAMKDRPGMFSPDESLFPLELQLHGYCACLHANCIEEDYEGRKFHPRDFTGWLYDELGWSSCLGFAYAIEENTPDKANAWETFFSLVEQFRLGSSDADRA